MFSIILVYLISTTELTQATNDNMPNKRELWTYLNAMDRMINFCASAKSGMDTNTYFGLFLMNVHLKAIIENKRPVLPSRLQNKLDALFKKGTMLTKYYNERLARFSDESAQLVSTLFSNESNWARRIKDYKFVVHKDKKEAKQRFEKRYRKWYKYIPKIKYTEPKKSHVKPGVCMMTLAENPETYFDAVVSQCSIDKICYGVILNGLDFGNALAFRVLLLLLARFGRGCSIFISVLDEDLTKRFCVAAYAESEQIILHYSNDRNRLMLEEMSLCSINGHPEFLQISWLSEIMKLQTPNGCFLDTGEHVKNQMNLDGRDKKIVSQRFRSRKEDAYNGVCSAQITAIAASVFAGAVRYIVSFHF